MASATREALLLALPAADAERALDDVLAERGFERSHRAPPPRKEPIARSDERFFDIDLVQPALSMVREWAGYGDATTNETATKEARMPPSEGVS